MNLKEVKHRILTIRSTQKITSAMKLVSSAKLRRTQAAIEAMRPYRDKLRGMLRFLMQDNSLQGNEYAVAREVKRVAIIAVASDTGLCGAFNANVSRLMNTAVDEYRKKGVDVTLYAVGSKIHNAAGKLGIEADTRLISQAGAPQYNAVAEVADGLMEQFSNGELDRVELIYTRFESMSRLVPVRETFLPLMNDDVQSDDESYSLMDLIVEPGSDELLRVLLPKSIALHLYTSLLDSAVSEHAARMVAMQLATDNADELIATLTLEYNKGRQQAITSEILDIVSGSTSQT